MQALRSLLRTLLGWFGFGRVSPPPAPPPPEPQPPSPPPPRPPREDPADKEPLEPVPPQPEPDSPPEREWTILIYMAGDNGLEFPTESGWTQILAEMTSAGYTDITELRTAGSTPQVQAVVGFDTVSENDRSYRIVIKGKRQAPEIIAIPEINTGDPVALRDFIIWGQKEFPARRYAVVLWNHGGGWKDEDIYADVRDLNRPSRRPPLFRSTPEKLGHRIANAPDRAKERWIAADDTSKDFLDNQEVVQAFREAREASGEPVHLIGMDACLMAMVEVAYQIREVSELLVASEEIEPMPGWPYTQILEALNARPEMSADELAQIIVDEYDRSYAESGESVTQSAIRLDRLEGLVERIGALVQAAERYQQDPRVVRALRRAQLYTPTFEDSDYRDLLELCRQIEVGIGELPHQGAPEGPAALVEALQQIYAYFENSDQSPILRSLASGERYAGADAETKVHGLSIYMPQSGTPLSPGYEELDFAASGWHRLLALLGGNESGGRRRPARE